MRLHFHPASTTSRIVQMFALEHGIELEYRVVDLFTGEHLKPEFARLNPNCLVPVLEDGDFRLTESAAILRYLADQAGTLDWGRQRTQGWLKTLDEKLIGCSTSAYPNISRRLRNMKALKHWAKVHEAIDGFAASLKGKPFVTV